MQNGNVTEGIRVAILGASARSGAVVREELKLGLNSLATVASIAPFVGFFGTLVGILSSFVGCGGSKSACMAVFADRLSGAMWPAALGLLVGLISLWFYRYLFGRVGAFERDMESASNDLVGQLARYRGQWELGPATGGRLLFGAKSPDELGEEHRFRRLSLAVAGVTLAVAWCIQVVLSFGRDSLPLSATPLAAIKHVLFPFGVSCIPAHILWLRFWRGRQGGRMALAALLCLGWCVVEVVIAP